MTYGLGTDGFNKKTLAEIRQELVDLYKSKIDSNINTQPETPLGQIIDISSERFSLLWELAESIYTSIDPDSAEGIMLDIVCRMVGIERLPALKSTVTATATGTNGTIIPIGTIFQVGNDDTNQFETLELATIPVGLSIDISCRNLITGVKTCTAAQLNTLVTQTSGLDSVTNTLAAIVGRDIETDTELRTRRGVSLTQSDAGTLEAIRAALLEVDSVTEAKVFENTTNATVSGRPPHSIEAVVKGGSDSNIANSIWETKGGGIATYGTETETITDSQGTDRNIKFSRPSDVDIYIIVNITKETGATVVEADVKTSVLAYFSGLELGSDVLPVTGVIPKIIGDVDGIRDIEVLAGEASPPTLDNPISVADTDLAVCVTDDITVNIS